MSYARQQQIIEDMNYYSDRRNRPGPRLTVTIYRDDPDNPGDYIEEEQELPTRWEVCSVCDGEGKHVNPSIDCGGLSAEDFHEDPDFAEDYFSGTYDVTCNRCGGRTTERVVDWEAMTDEQREAYEEECQAEADFRAEQLAELRMGA